MSLHSSSRCSVRGPGRCVVLAVLALIACKASAPQATSDTTSSDETPQILAANAVSGDSVLRVCADPNNLPFSNARGEGFENEIAKLVASDLHERLEYIWWAQRRGYVRNTLSANKCDVWVGVASGMGPVLTTQPYYRSTYVFMTRASDPIRIASFNDPVLKHVRIGVQLVGDDGANTPPAHALSRRHIISNVRGYHLESDYRQPNPPSRILEALARHDIDVAVVWGPLGGYFAKREAVPLRVTAVAPQIDLPFLPFVFDISMGARRSDSLLVRRLDSVIVRRRPDIDRILASYGVPRADAPLVQ
jgi:mxaJ protein